MDPALCEACIRKPGGIEGHHGLFLDAADVATRTASPAILFTCVHCATHWWRTYMGDGVFLWNHETHPRLGERDAEEKR